ITKGGLTGDVNEPRNVLIVGDEDSIDENWTPRVVAAGGDEGRVFALAYDDGTALDLVRDIAVLEQHARAHGLAYVYFDQLLAHIGAQYNANLPKDVRAALAPLRPLAGKLEITIAYASHPTKASGPLALRERTGGSHQFVEVPRVGLLLGYHPD